MSNLKSATHLRQLLWRASRKYGSQAALAREIGITRQALYSMLSGSPITGKAVTWLGFQKSTESRYEKVK